MIEFRDIDYSDRDLVLRHTLHSSTRNCDFNFMNLVSWSFIYGTQIAVHRGLLVVRFRFEGRTAYLPPLCAKPIVTTSTVRTTPPYSSICLKTPKPKVTPSA